MILKNDDFKKKGTSIEQKNSANKKISALSLVRGNSDFRHLWFGQIISLFGDWFTLIASATMLAGLTHSGGAVSVLFVLRMLGPFLVSPLAGVAADRYNRKKLLIITDIIRAVIVLGFFFVKDVDDIWLLYVLTTLQLCISGFFFPARNALLPSIVSLRELGVANALSSATWSIMLALGTALGGLITGFFGVYIAFSIDALSFIISALCIARIQYHPSFLKKMKSSPPAFFRQYIEGMRYLCRHIDILAIVLHKAAVTLTTAGGFQVIQVALAEKVFVIGNRGGIGMGIMFAIVGIGTGVGPVIARWFTGDRDGILRMAISISYLMITLGVTIAATMINFETVLTGIFLRGIGGGIVWVFSTQLLMQQVPHQVQGRVFGTEFGLFTLMSALSAALSGWSIDNPAVGLAGTMWWMAGLSLIPALLWTVYNKARPFKKAFC